MFHYKFSVLFLANKLAECSTKDRTTQECKPKQTLTYNKQYQPFPPIPNTTNNRKVAQKVYLSRTIYPTTGSRKYMPLHQKNCSSLLNKSQTAKENNHKQFEYTEPLEGETSFFSNFEDEEASSKYIEYTAAFLEQPVHVINDSAYSCSELPFTSKFLSYEPGLLHTNNYMYYCISDSFQKTSEQQNRNQMSSDEKDCNEKMMIEEDPKTNIKVASNLNFKNLEIRDKNKYENLCDFIKNSVLIFYIEKEIKLEFDCKNNLKDYFNFEANYTSFNNFIIIFRESFKSSIDELISCISIHIYINNMSEFARKLKIYLNSNTQSDSESKIVELVEGSIYLLTETQKIINSLSYKDDWTLRTVMLFLYKFNWAMLKNIIMVKSYWIDTKNRSVYYKNNIDVIYKFNYYLQSRYDIIIKNSNLMIKHQTSSLSPSTFFWKNNVFVAINAKIHSGVKIGKNTYIGQKCEIKKDSIIGDDCWLSRNVYIAVASSIGNNNFFGYRVTLCDIDEKINTAINPLTGKIPFEKNSEVYKYMCGNVKLGNNNYLDAFTILSSCIQIQDNFYFPQGSLVDIFDLN
ncbi:hypothetical protein COBT_000367 [Conglomerata obtusa]